MGRLTTLFSTGITSMATNQEKAIEFLDQAIKELKSRFEWDSKLLTLLQLAKRELENK